MLSLSLPDGGQVLRDRFIGGAIRENKRYDRRSPFEVGPN
jgi:hypothetical protein